MTVCQVYAPTSSAGEIEMDLSTISCKESSAVCQVAMPYLCVMGDFNAKIEKSNLGDNNGIMGRFGFG